MSIRRADDLGTVELTVPALLTATPISKDHTSASFSFPCSESTTASGTIAGSFFARRAFEAPSVPAMPHTLPRRWNTPVGHSPPPLGIAGLRMRGADRLSGLAPGLGVLSMFVPILSVPMQTTCFSPFSLSYPHSFSFLACFSPLLFPFVSTVSPHKRPRSVSDSPIRRHTT